MMDTGHIINGMNVVVSEALAEFDIVPRTWKERLFTLPWTPWRAYRQEPKPPVFLFDQQAGIIYTTKRGWLALRSQTQTAH